LDRQFNAGSDLTGQQRAVEQYLELLATARGAGPIDEIRWGAVLTRVSRLTQIPVDQLHRRFRSPRIGSRAIPTTERQHAPAPATAQVLAERWILGILLHDPARWHGVQQCLRPEEFTDASHRQLAEVYWTRQRDDGEPVFSEFLNDLATSHMKELAIALLEEADALEDKELVLNEGLRHFESARQRAEQRKLVAQLHRGEDEKKSADDELDVLKKMQESARRPDLRRVVS
jgi:hypothetical protein